MKTKFLIITSLLSFALFIGCSPNETAETTIAAKTITTDDAVANSDIDASVDDVSSIVEDQLAVQLSSVSRTSEPVKSILPLCCTITTVVGETNVTKTIDFGTEGCTMPNGNVLKGKIIISFSKNTLLLKRTINYTLENFYHNGNLIEGSKSITHENKSTDLLAVSHPVTIHTIDLKVTFADGKVFTRVGTNTREMTEGFTTFGNWEDNVFLVSGNHTTTFPDGSKYTSTITTPLKFKASCRVPFPVEGVVETKKNDVVATLDYGNGDCDNLATFTTGGVSKQIELKRKKM